MTTRRQFCQGMISFTGLALGGSAFAGSDPLRASLSDGVENLDFHTVVYEPGVAASADFGAAVRRAGMPAYAIDGDITGLWTSELADLWRTRPVAIAGMTGYPALFLLERFGWDHGLRVVFRAEHTVTDRHVLHRLEGPITLLGRGQATLPQQSRFGACMAGLVTRCPAVPEPRSATVLASADMVVATDSPALYSWVIAPQSALGTAVQGLHATERTL